MKGQELRKSLLQLVDEDTMAFNRIMEAFGLPKNTAEDVAVRKDAIENATKGAIAIPFQIMEKSMASMEIMKAMAEMGLQASVSDAGVGALCARTAVKGAFLNVKINASALKDEAYKQDVLKKGNTIQTETEKLEKEILEVVEGKL